MSRLIGADEKRGQLLLDMKVPSVEQSCIQALYVSKATIVPPAASLLSVANRCLVSLHLRMEVSVVSGRKSEIGSRSCMDGRRLLEVHSEA